MWDGLEYRITLYIVYMLRIIQNVELKKVFLVISQGKIMIPLIGSILILYIFGLTSKGVMNIDFYIDWTRAIINGNLYEIYNIENGRSTSAENETLIVPYPPLSLYLLWLSAKFILFFFPESYASLLLACNLLAVSATFCTVFLIRFTNLNIFRNRYLLYLLSPTVFLLSPILGYQDSVMILFIVAGLLLIQSDKLFLGGVLFGAAIMAKQLAFMPVFSIFIFFLFRGELQKLVKWCLGIALSLILVLSPFIVSGNLFAYIESQVLASVHTMLAPQTANIPWLITLVYRVFTNGLSGGFAIGGNGLRIEDDVLRQLVYIGFGLTCILVFMFWFIRSIKKFGRNSIDIWSTSTMMILSYYLFAAGVHENHIFMAFAIILCVPSQKLVVKSYIALSTGLLVHLFTSWGLGRSFQDFSEATHLSLSYYSVCTLAVLAAYIFAFLQISRVPGLRFKQERTVDI